MPPSTPPQRSDDRDEGYAGQVGVAESDSAGAGVGSKVASSASSTRRKARRPLAAGEHGDLEVGGRQRRGPDRRGRDDRGVEGAAQVEAGLERLLEASADGLGVAADDAVAVLVDDGAVVEDVEELVVRRRVAPTSATRISTSIGFISWVKIWPSIWA